MYVCMHACVCVCSCMYVSLSLSLSLFLCTSLSLSFSLSLFVSLSCKQHAHTCRIEQANGEACCSRRVRPTQSRWDKKTCLMSKWCFQTCRFEPPRRRRGLATPSVLRPARRRVRQNKSQTQTTHARTHACMHAHARAHTHTHGCARRARRRTRHAETGLAEGKSCCVDSALHVCIFICAIC